MYSGSSTNESAEVTEGPTTFEDVVLPHLGAAYRLARWMAGNEHDAEDIVQDASLRALKYFRTFSGRNARAWFLRIIRTTCWSRHRSHAGRPSDEFDEDLHSGPQPAMDPEVLLLQADSAAAIEQALTTLPDRFRELLVLRELEGLSYQELADVLAVPIGTVMSGLSRARRALRRALEDRAGASEMGRPSPEPATQNRRHRPATGDRNRTAGASPVPLVPNRSTTVDEPPPCCS
ncbi:MAG: sigma-70 family RNA polymerase sigma factor [Vicinamibacterales bacterium]